MTELSDRSVPPEIERHLRDWWTISNINRVIQVLLGITGIASALTVATFTDQLGTTNTKIFSFVAALSFGLVNGFDIGGKADATRNAWRHLTTAILKFKTDPSYTYEELIRAYSEGEAMVGGVPLRMQPSPAPPSTPGSDMTKH
jgi:hypothetical protein